MQAMGFKANGQAGRGQPQGSCTQQGIDVSQLDSSPLS